MQLPTSLRGEPRAELDDLETKILILMSRNYTDADIAQVLATDAETIECVIHGLFSKLGVSSRLAATVWMMKRRRHDGSVIRDTLGQPWDGSPADNS